MDSTFERSTTSIDATNQRPNEAHRLADTSSDFPVESTPKKVLVIAMSKVYLFEKKTTTSTNGQ